MNTPTTAQIEEVAKYVGYGSTLQAAVEHVSVVSRPLVSFDTLLSAYCEHLTTNLSDEAKRGLSLAQSRLDERTYAEERVTLSHSEVAGPVRSALAGNRGSWSKAGRVVSGLLKAAVKAKTLTTKTHSGRVSGYAVWYVGTPEAIEAIRAEALRRLA